MEESILNLVWTGAAKFTVLVILGLLVVNLIWRGIIPFVKAQGHPEAAKHARFPVLHLLLVVFLGMGVFLFWNYEPMSRKASGTETRLPDKWERTIEERAEREIPFKPSQEESREERQRRMLAEAEEKRQRAREEFNELPDRR